MGKVKYVFAQLLSLLDSFVFLRIVKKYEGDKHIKHFSCWNQLAVLMFSQLSNIEYLRDAVLTTQAHTSNAYHLGFGKAATRSNLSKANKTRDYRIFEEFAYCVVTEAKHCKATDIFNFSGKVHAFDSTTIDMCLSVFELAMFRERKEASMLIPYDIDNQIYTFFHITPAKLHNTQAKDVIPYEENAFHIVDRAYSDFKRPHNIESVNAYFVVRGKKNNDFRPVKWKCRFPPDSGILSDAVGAIWTGSFPGRSIRTRSAASFIKTATRRRSSMHWISVRL